MKDEVMERQELKQRKTRRVAGQHVSSDVFAFVGSPDDVASWRFCICIPGDLKKTENLISSALEQIKAGHFPAVIPETQREAVKFLIFGAALAHNMRVDRELLTIKSNEPDPAPAGEPAEQVKVTAPAPEVDEAILLADRAAEKFLRAMGLD